MFDVRLALLAVLILRCTTMAAEPSAPATTQPTEAQAIDTLRRVMHDEERFVKVHAAEALIDLGLPAGVREVFVEQERQHRDVPTYRVGVWRALARATAGTPDHDAWLANIRKVALDATAPDQMAAIESLAKLKYVPAADERPVVETLAAGDNEGMALFATWLLSHAPGVDNPQDRLARYVGSADPISRLRAIFILRLMPNLSAENRAKVKATARAEPKDTLTYAYVTSASFTIANHYDDADEAARCHAELLRLLRTGQPVEKQEACRALGEHGSRDDVAALAPLLTDAAPPARVGAGLAIARLLRTNAEGD